MKQQTGNGKIRIAFLACIGVMLFTGCGGKQPVEEQTQPEQTAQQPGEEQAQPTEENMSEPAEDSASEKEGVPDSADAEDKPEADGENAGKEPSLQEAQIRHYYSGILSQIIAAWQFPDGEMDTSALDGGYGEMCDNHFAVTDIDGDGREELIVSYSNASMAGMMEIIYDYNPVLGELKRELTVFPALTYYDNGIIKAEHSHNQGPGEFWPFTLYRYEPESDSYVEAGSVDTWDREYREEWYEGQPFPDELDTDHDGTMYHICKEGEERSYEYEDYKYNEADFEEWFGTLTEGAKELSVDYRPMEYESFADFTPAYLKLLAEHAGKERTDTASDLGLLILQEEHFLDAAKTLLTEKYGVELEQPDPDFEEWTVGCKDGNEVFSFEALNAGHIGYQGEQMEDVTIFGIYPGISVDGAWEKLKTYGFYASPYGEVENCLITGEGFGNVSIWFSEEDNIVTEITVGPYCAFAG